MMSLDVAPKLTVEVGCAVERYFLIYEKWSHLKCAQ